METMNAILRLWLRQTFDAVEAAGGYRTKPPAMPAGYAKALAAQKAEKEGEGK